MAINTDYNADLYARVGGSANSSPASGVVQDMETRFLTLLMAQMRNQDPLNPLDNAQVTTQLAQLSTVTGIEKLNETMTRLLAGYNEAQAMQAASMVGRSVMIAGNNLPMVEGQSIAGIGLAGPADQVQVTIRDESGKIV
ncbi:MAG: flagellar biosynthesis protein FlgD, partial [Betaproteobacteria bacterium]|nr:flagellar biosynthesis protein FlgD [Betaproteobacteria bacterium]